MVRAFFSWWGRQLVETLPARWRRTRPAHESGDAVLLALDPAATRPSFDATRRRQRRDVALGRFALDPPGLASLRGAIGTGRNLRLLLPPNLVLEQEIAMPLAAERELETALRWEMDRLTPFPADAVFWSWLVDRRDRVRGKLHLRLRLVPKASVERALEALASVGLAPAMIASAADPSRTIPLRPTRSGWATRSASTALGTLCILLLATAIALPFLRQERALRRVNATIASLRPEVDVADSLRRRLQDRAASAGVVAAEAVRVGDTVRILSAVTDVLPDDTYLFGLTLRDRMLTVTGQSASAAKLIPAMASAPAFQNPVFAAPITRNELTSAETFSIRTEVRP